MSDRTCSESDCPKPVKSRGMCATHYHRWWRQIGSPSRCTIPWCPKPMHGLGWCSAHYTRWKRTGDPLGTRRESPEERFDRQVTVQPDGCHIWTGTQGAAMG